MTRASPPRVVVATVVVAWVLAVGAQVAAAVWGSGAPAPVRPSSPPVRDVGCGEEGCRVLASTVVNGMPVELLVDSGGTLGRLRAGGPATGTVTTTALTDDGVRLNQNSLRCATSATPVCLVRGPHDGGMTGEVHVWRGDSWESAGGPYFSDLGAVTLDEVVGSGMPEVLVVREVCADAGGSAVGGDCSEYGALAEVMDLGGGRAGCSPLEAAPDELPGWPEVDLRQQDLTDCPVGLGAS